MSLSKKDKFNHRDIGKEFNLFSFMEHGPGMPFFKKNGLQLKNDLINYSRKLHKLNGYDEIESPILLSKELWERSGHWEHFKSNMFIADNGKRQYAVKPMSCPGAILLYKEKKRSYKEFPMRLLEYGKVHRNEDSGSLNGLLRVRSFVQDDAHIFCLKDQLKNEIKNILELSEKILNAFNFKDFKFELSVRSKQFDKYLGDDQSWNFAEMCLENSLLELSKNYVKSEGEAKFYGPSIDIHILDSQGKSWQCSSVQLDFNLGHRFNLKYVDKYGKYSVPFILHRAIYGSVERFMGILLENHGLDLPFWLKPQQYRILALGEKNLSFSNLIHEEFINNGLKGELDGSNNSLANKIKAAKLEQVPYLIIIGDKESSQKNISVKLPNGKQLNSFSCDEIINYLLEEQLKSRDPIS